MTRALAIGYGLIYAIVLTGCGGSQPARMGYLYRYGNGESFLQWHRHGRTFYGTLSTTGWTCCSPMPVRLFRTTETIKGTISGSKFVVHQPNGNPNLVATLHSYGLLVVNTSGSSTDIGVRYRRATVADYNTAVAQTEATVERIKKRETAKQATTSAGP